MAHVVGDPAAVQAAGLPAPLPGPGQRHVRAAYDLPLFAIVGGTFTAIAFVVIVVLHPAVAVVGVGWLSSASSSTSLFRRRHGLDLTSTHKVAIPQPVVDHEAEYDSVLVPLARRRYDEHGDGHRGQAGRARAPRDPRARAGHRAQRAADRRADGRARRRRPSR